MALRKLAVGAFKNQSIILLNERHLFKRTLGALSALPRLAMEQLTVFFVTPCCSCSLSFCILSPEGFSTSTLRGLRDQLTIISECLQSRFFPGQWWKSSRRRVFIQENGNWRQVVFSHFDSASIELAPFSKALRDGVGEWLGFCPCMRACPFEESLSKAFPM